MIEVHVEILGVGTAWGTLKQQTGQAEIKWLFISYDQRGHGHGRRLLDALEARLAHRGAGEVHTIADAIDASVATATYIPQLVEWYERRGYTHHGEQRLSKTLAATAPSGT